MKKFLILSSLLLLSSTLIGCNQQVIDTTWKFNKAIITIGDETIEVEVDSWKDYEDSSSIQIKTKDGVTYLTDLKNAVLISE